MRLKRSPLTNTQQPDDREAVKQAVLDYVEALYEADSARIERSVHRDLFKLGFERDKDGTYKPYRMTYQELYDLAGRWNKSGRIPKNSKKERLPAKHFTRIHRSTIINVEYVERLESWFNRSYRIHLRQMAEPLVMSRRYAARFKTTFG